MRVCGAGGVFNLSATVRYTGGGETVTIRQNFLGIAADGMMRLTTQLTGNVPNIDSDAEFEVADYAEDYQRDRQGTDGGGGGRSVGRQRALSRSR